MLSCAFGLSSDRVRHGIRLLPEKTRAQVAIFFDAKALCGSIADVLGALASRKKIKNLLL